MNESGVSDGPADGPSDTTQMNLDWRENLKHVAPDYIAEWDEFKNADSPEKFFDQLKNHRSMIGQSVRIPGEDAGAAQMQEFYDKIQNKVPGLIRSPDMSDPEQTKNLLKKIGLPDSADDYAASEGVSLDAETLGNYKAIALEAGLTKDQFKAFTDKLSARAAYQNDVSSTKRQEDKAGLLGEWGSAYDQRTSICARVAEKTGAPDNLVSAIKSGDADSKTMRWLYSLSTQFGGEGINFNMGQDAVDTPADLQGQLADITGNVDGPYWNSSHPGHKLAVDKAMKIRRTLAGQL